MFSGSCDRCCHHNPLAYICSYCQILVHATILSLYRQIVIVSLIQFSKIQDEHVLKLVGDVYDLGFSPTHSSFLRYVDVIICQEEKTAPKVHRNDLSFSFCPGRDHSILLTIG